MYQNWQIPSIPSHWRFMRITSMQICDVLHILKQTKGHVSKFEILYIFVQFHKEIRYFSKGSDVEWNGCINVSYWINIIVIKFFLAIFVQKNKELFNAPRKYVADNEKWKNTLPIMACMYAA
jgi:hypothetical protein